MSNHNPRDTISVNLLFFIAMSFALVSAQLKKCNAGYYCHSTNPGLYLQCVPYLGLLKWKCPSGTFFNTDTIMCDWPQNSNCYLQMNKTTSPNSVATTITTGPTPTTVRTTRYGMAKPCDPNICKLPNCRCADESIPGHLKLKTVPQMVLITFDDGVNNNNINYYRKLNNQNLTNPDGCPIGLTYFVSGDYTNYKFVEELYKKGHEIASHSKTHKFPIHWWSSVNYEEFKDEMVGMRILLSKSSSIPVEKITGTRVPFLQLSGDVQFRVLKDNHFTWDSSMLSRRQERPIWPFTLDYQVTVKNCQIAPCPKKSYPGFWEVPLIHWKDSDGTLYSMPDTNNKPKTKAEMTDFFHKNFEAHYKTNRAPFGIFIHATWFNKMNFNFEVLQDFLKYLVGKKDVWVIPVSRAVDWVRNPKPIKALSEIPSWYCSKRT